MNRIRLFATIFFFVLAPQGLFAADFTDNGDGTVTDNDTNLMWMQATAANTMTWKAALAYCENLTHAGYSDWRLPNIKELRSIADYSTYGPAIDTAFFPDTHSNLYWASTTNAYNTDCAWLVYFSYGYGYSYSKSDTYYVRAVRGGQ